MNYTNLRGRVEQEINRSDVSTNISNWIYDTRKEIIDGTLPGANGAYRFSWSYNVSNLVTATSNEFSLPSDFVDELSLFDLTNERPLVKVDSPSYYDSLFYSSQNIGDLGNPTNYVITGETFLIYPKGEVSVKFQYYSYPTELSTGTDEFAIDRKVPTLIIYGAALKTAIWLHDPELVALYTEMVGRYYSSAMASDRKRTMANRMVRFKTHHDYRMEHWKGMRFIPS